MGKNILILILIVLSGCAFGQTTDFTYSTGSNACLPVDIQFNQTSSGTPKGYLWDFGNGTKSNAANPVTTYSAAGSYSVRLITVYENSTAVKRRTVVIQPSITASFIYDRNFLCQPGTVNFTATTSGNLANFIWDFGDGTPSVTDNANNIAHSFSNFGEFTVTLKAVSNSGCEVTSSRLVKIVEPVISGSITTALLGCAPLSTNFDINVSLPPGSNISNYLWNFGDGASLATTTAQVNHNYTAVGSFSPSVTITTVEGCTSSFNFDSIATGRPPTNHNAYPIDTVYCGSDVPQFVSTANSANRYDWDFGGGSITSVTDTTVEHRYSNLGPKSITVTPYFNGCAGSPINFNINIIGVIARFTYANTCNDRKTFKFKNTSQGNMSTVNWSLGNQGYSNNVDTVSHTYPQFGVFGVKILVTDNITGCIDTFKTRIYTANPVLKNPDSSICINSDTHFTIGNNYTNPSVTYLWNVLGNEIGPNAEASPTILADSLGHFNNQVIISNGPQYCPDTAVLDHPITVRGPKLDFTMPASICLNDSLAVVNLSAPYQPADSIKIWYWNFGLVANNDFSYQPSPYSYSNPKIYNVKLTAIDIYGCKDTLVKRVNVRPMPFLWIIPKSDTLCEGQSSTLVGYTSDNILWSSSNSSLASGYCNNCDTTAVRPVLTTSFYATATNSFNCTATDSAIVKVFNPFTASSPTPDTAVCAGLKVPFTVAPEHKVVTWSPAASLNNSNIYNPVASPDQTTIYTASLSDSAGCFTSSTDIKVTVKSKPEISAGPDKVYPYNSTFSFAPTYSANIRTWLWSPSDSLTCSSCPAPSGIAASTKTYVLRATTDSGCVATDNVTIFVECKGANLLMPAAFTPNYDKLNDLYHPITRGIKSIVRFSIYNRQGQLVYEARNYIPNKNDIGWDGKFRNQQQGPSAYVYIIEAICDIGQTIFSKGSFLLVR